MILTKEVEIKIRKNNIDYYKEKISNDIKLKEIYKINPLFLEKGSHIKVEVECYVCKKILIRTYQRYCELSKDSGIYYCNDCKFEKTKYTNLKIYGTFSPMQNDEIKKKSISTNLKKYNVEYTFQSELVKNNIKKTLLEKYNVDHISKYKIHTDSVSKIQINNYINSFHHKDNLIINYNKDLEEYTLECKLCNNNYNIHRLLLRSRLTEKSTLCTICNPMGKSFSDREFKLLNFIKENYNGEIIINSRKIIPPQELDIYLPELQLAFEFNGVYWHNELHRPNDYHKLKTDSCLEKGIQLIHIYEDDWNFKQNMIKSMILNSLNKNKLIIKSKIKEITDDKLIEKFLNNNHLDGFINSDIRIGLFDKNELISLMLFKILENNKYELLRVCDKLNMNIYNSEIKLFKYFIKKYKSSEIISYVDRSYNNDIIYKQLGFKLSHITNPNYKYVINGIREKCDDDLKNNIYKIYDSGDYVFKYN